MTPNRSLQPTTIPLRGLSAAELKRCEPGKSGSRLMRVMEKTFGKRVTTRTLDTVRKCVAT